MPRYLSLVSLPNIYDKMLRVELRANCNTFYPFMFCHGARRNWGSAERIRMYPTAVFVW